MVIDNFRHAAGTRWSLEQIFRFAFTVCAMQGLGMSGDGNGSAIGKCFDPVTGSFDEGGL